jgi:hypothetical protein
MSQKKFIIIIIVLIVSAVAIWFFFFRSAAPAGDQSSGTPDAALISSNPDVQRIERELADLRRLKDLQIDTSILQNPFLQSLEAPRTPQGTGTTTVPAIPGRPNPFIDF